MAFSALRLPIYTFWACGIRARCSLRRPSLGNRNGVEQFSRQTWIGNSLSRGSLSLQWKWMHIADLEQAKAPCTTLVVPAYASVRLLSHATVTHSGVTQALDRHVIRGSHRSGEIRPWIIARRSSVSSLELQKQATRCRTGLRLWQWVYLQLQFHYSTINHLPSINLAAAE